MLGQLLKAIFNLFCGSPSPSPEQPPQPGPPTQQHPSGQQHPATIPPTYPQGQQKPSRPPKKYQDQNQANQSNEYYVSLRARANEHGDQMAKRFQEGHEAYARGDGALAKELSNKGKEHQRKMEQLNKEASDFIFVENNKAR
ncbi:hypothetical protein NLJ89_g2268 [Agrocybe chaxingu]|uniref:DUF1771 domain-containing protein n=1 Tax=Agrocybe chaxingu TaxID=84603 RepID=A0A9W8KCG0_9AGAR|nr:hypothetical protein NLJ89_g2268 [Agrocybe chaxingu]